MRRNWWYIIFLFFAVGNKSSLVAQTGDDVIHVKDNQMIITIDSRRSTEYQNLLLYFGLNEDSLFEFGNIGPLAKDGWKLVHLDKRKAVIARPLSMGGDDIDWGNAPIIFDMPNGNTGTPGYPGPVDYGVNSFIGAPTVFENAKDETVFYLKQHLDAGTVYLSGNFNNWSTTQTAMQKTDSGWVSIIKLKPGKYFYKFIIDGNWIYDLNNNVKEPDGYDAFNSTYFHYDYTFHLPGNAAAKKVYVSGSFNQWREKELPMQKTSDGWILPLYLREGTHAYKFIVDGEWILDPVNPTVRADGMGHFNSYVGIGTTTEFVLNGFTDARLVLLSGSFNNWNTAELEMQRTPTGWKLPYVVGPGNYEYKFIVDGRWITDPANPLTVGAGETMNSVLIVQPNYTFTYKNATAKEVYLSGSFIAWADPGYKMIHVNDEWIYPLFLPSGKYTYKLVVDGQWITDPANPLYEENEYNTGNSVLWIDPATEFIEK